MGIYIPNTIVRVGTMPTPLLETARKFDPRFIPSPSPLGHSEQCVILDTDKTNPYMMMVSKSLFSDTSVKGYNSMFSVTSYDLELSRSLYERFCTSTGLRFREAPKMLEELAARLVTPMFVLGVEVKR